MIQYLSENQGKKSKNLSKNQPETENQPEISVFLSKKQGKTFLMRYQMQF